MPFTLSHAAAALPFRNLRLVLSALVIGTFAPDFEYFLRLAPSSGFGHTLLGVLVFTLPLGLLVLWLFHSYVKGYAASLLPDGLQLRLVGYLGPFSFFGGARFPLILISLMLGIATHIVWDNLTHPSLWLYQHWDFLRQSSSVPFIGLTPHYKILQHTSTAFGLAVLCAWFARWYRTTTPVLPTSQLILRQFSAGRKLYTTAQISILAAAGSMVRVIAILDAPDRIHPLEHLVGATICTFIAIVWWQLVAYGLITRGRQRFLPAPNL